MTDGDGQLKQPVTDRPTDRQERTAKTTGDSLRKQPVTDRPTDRH